MSPRTFGTGSCTKGPPWALSRPRIPAAAGTLGLDLWPVF